MNTSGVLRGVSLAVPAATMARIAKTLVEHGRVRRGYLGVGVQPARLAKPHGSLGQTTGLLIASVEDGSPAEKGGLFLGDVLLTMGGKPLASMDDLLSALGGDVVGQSAALEVMRGGKVSSIQVAIGERPAPVEEEEE
jgi:S1-C subfamily serine protease